MKTKLLQILNKWPKNYIFSSDLKPIFITSSDDSFHSLLKRAVQDGTLIRVKRDLYLIGSQIEDVKPDSFEIAALIYGPSCISMESALSFHGWIPEAVPITISACTKKTKNFETPIGTFSYYHIPLSIFHVGISTIKNYDSNFFIADPWKALADLIYFKKKSWPNSISLSNDMRIEMDLMQHFDLQLLEKLMSIYPSKIVRKTLKSIFKDLNK